MKANPEESRTREHQRESISSENEGGEGKSKHHPWLAPTQRGVQACV